MMFRANGLPTRKRLGVLAGGKKFTDIQIPEFAIAEYRQALACFTDPNCVEDKVKEVAEANAGWVLRALKVVVKQMTSQLETFAKDIVQPRAIKEGILISVDRACCHEKRCGTCGGKRNTHYPKWRIKDGRWRSLRRKEERDFFRKIDVPEESIDEYENIYDLRDVWLGILNYTEEWMEKGGLIKEGAEIVERNL